MSDKRLEDFKLKVIFMRRKGFDCVVCPNTTDDNWSVTVTGFAVCHGCGLSYHIDVLYPQYKDGSKP